MAEAIPKPVPSVPIGTIKGMQGHITHEYIKLDIPIKTTEIYGIVVYCSVV